MSDPMTEDEILRRAEEITARRKRAAQARKVMRAKEVEIVAYFDIERPVHIPVPIDANLAAFLCRVLDCEITEGGDNV